MPAVPVVMAVTAVAGAASSIVAGNSAKTAGSRAAGHMEQVGALNREARYQDALTQEMITNENVRRTRLDSHNFEKIHTMNQKVLADNEAATEKAISYQLESADYNAKKFLGTQMAEYGASGADLGVGSPVSVMLESKRMSDRTIASMKEQGAAELMKLNSQKQIDEETSHMEIQRMNEEADFILAQGQAKAKALRMEGDIEYENALSGASSTRSQGRIAAIQGYVGGVSAIGGFAGNVKQAGGFKNFFA